jgi:hypothetical protein
MCGDGRVNTAGINERIVGTDPHHGVTRVTSKGIDKTSKDVVGRSAHNRYTQALTLRNQSIVQLLGSRCD